MQVLRSPNAKNKKSYVFINDNRFQTNIEKLYKISDFFKEKSVKRGDSIIFNSVSCHDSLDKFFDFIDKDKSRIIDDDWFEILEIALEWKCCQKVIDTIFSNIIICLNCYNGNYDDHFFNQSAEKLSNLIKYMPFTLLSISTISNLFESRYACLPSQIELTNFVIRYFNVAGVSAISFVHYIDPKCLPPPKLACLNKKFKEFDCSYLFPEFQFSIPKPSEMMEITLQCERAKLQKENIIEKLQSLKKQTKTDGSDMEKISLSIEEKKRELEQKEGELKKIKDENKDKDESYQKINQLSAAREENMKILKDLQREHDTNKSKYDEYNANNKYISKYQKEIDKFFINDGIYEQMKDELNRMKEQNKEIREIMEENKRNFPT